MLTLPRRLHLALILLTVFALLAAATGCGGRKRDSGDTSTPGTQPPVTPPPIVTPSVPTLPIARWASLADMTAVSTLLKEVSWVLTAAADGIEELACGYTAGPKESVAGKEAVRIDRFTLDGDFLQEDTVWVGQDGKAVRYLNHGQTFDGELAESFAGMWFMHSLGMLAWVDHSEFFGALTGQRTGWSDWTWKVVSTQQEYIGDNRFTVTRLEYVHPSPEALLAKAVDLKVAIAQIDDVHIIIDWDMLMHMLDDVKVHVKFTVDKAVPR